MKVDCDKKEILEIKLQEELKYIYDSNENNIDEFVKNELDNSENNDVIDEDDKLNVDTPKNKYKSTDISNDVINSENNCEEKYSYPFLNESDNHIKNNECQIKCNDNFHDESKDKYVEIFDKNKVKIDVDVYEEIKVDIDENEIKEDGKEAVATIDCDGEILRVHIDKSYGDEIRVHRDVDKINVDCEEEETKIEVHSNKPEESMDPFLCPVCDIKYENRDLLREHTKSIHREKVEPSPMCSLFQLSRDFCCAIDKSRSKKLSL